MKSNKKQVSQRRNANKSGNNQNYNDGNLEISNAFQRLPRTKLSNDMLGMPDRYITRLRFVGLGNLTIPTTSTVAGGRYRPSAAYDIDPLIASTSTAYFAEFAAIYNSYRVNSSTLRVKATNQVNTSGQGIIVVIVPLLEDPGASPTASVVGSWLEQPYSKKSMVGTAGSPAVNIEQTMSTEKIFGTKAVYFDDGHSSLVTTNPSLNWYWAIGAICATAPVSALIVNTYLEIEIEVEFFQRKALLQ